MRQRFLSVGLALCLLVLAVVPAQAAAPPRPGQPYADARCSTDPSILVCEDFDFPDNFICAGATGNQGFNQTWKNPGWSNGGPFGFQYCNAADFPKLSSLNVPIGRASGGVYRAQPGNGSAAASYDACILGDCDRNTADKPMVYKNGAPASKDLYIQFQMLDSGMYRPQNIDNKILFLYPNKYTGKSDANVDAGLYLNASGRCNPGGVIYNDALSFREGSNSQGYKWFPAHLSRGSYLDYCPAAAPGVKQPGKLFRMPNNEQWFTIEFRYLLSDPGKKNGAIEMWVDGVKLYSATDLETCGNYGANEGDCYAIHEIFFEGSWFNPNPGGDAGPAQANGGFRLIDDLIISTSYIGLVSDPAPTPTPDPTPVPDPVPPPTPPPAASGTYYTATTGNDSNSCTAAQNPATPKRTIRAGIACLSAGNTLLVQPGTYAEALNNPFANTGSSWAQKITVKANGAARSVVIRPPSGENGLWFNNSTQKYAEFDGIEIDATNVSVYGIGIRGTAHHLRFRNGAVLNSQNQGVLAYGDSGNRLAPSNNEFIDMEVAYTAMTQSGSPKSCNGSNEATKNGYCHGFYVGSNNNLLERVNLHHNNGYGVQFYPQGHSGNIIRDSLSHDNYSTGIGSLGNNNQLINNVVWGNGYGMLITESGTQALHNTVIGEMEFRDGGGWTAKNNIVTGGLSGISDSSNLTSGNPGFVGGSDYHLTASSPAINKVPCLSSVPKDRDGVTRPQGASCDQGAYEFGGTVTPPPPPQTFTLSTSTSGTGNGTVAKNPNSASYQAGTAVAVTANPASGSTFAGWSGACSGLGSCVVTMDANKSVTAQFALVVTPPPPPPPPPSPTVEQRLTAVENQLTAIKSAVCTLTTRSTVRDALRKALGGCS